MADEVKKMEPGPEAALIGYVEELFNEFDSARLVREDKLIECYWNTLNEYSPGIQGQWRSREAEDDDASKIFMGQTADKVRGAYAQISDALTGTEFELEPVSIEGVDEEDAAARVEKMTETIEDFMKMGEFGQMLNKIAFSGSWSGMGIFRAPVLAEDVKLDYLWDPKLQTMTGQRESTTYPKAVMVDPFTFYPDPKGDNAQDGRGWILLHVLDPSELRREGKALGWDLDAINKALKEGSNEDGDGEKWITSLESAKDETDRDNQREIYKVKDFWGIAKVSDLKSYKVEVTSEIVGFEVTDDDYVECNLVISGSHVLKAVLNPWYPVTYRPLETWQYDLQPSNQWGVGPAEQMLPQQKVINGGYRLWMDNKGITANPMIEIDPEALVPGQDLTSVFPGKKWIVKKGMLGQAVGAIIIPDISDNIVTLIKAMEANAENNTGLTYIQNQASSETATAAAIDQSKLTATNRARLRRLDEIVEKILEWFVRWVNEFGDPETYKDVKIPVTVKASGILKTALVRELQTLRMQNLIPMLQQAMAMPKIGPEGTALEGFDMSRFFRHLFKGMGVEDVELSDGERKEIILEALQDFGDLLRQMLDAGAGEEEIRQLIGNFAGGSPEAGAGLPEAQSGAGGQAPAAANGAAPAQLAGGAGDLYAGAADGVAG